MVSFGTLPTPSRHANLLSALIVFAGPASWPMLLPPTTDLLAPLLRMACPTPAAAAACAASAASDTAAANGAAAGGEQGAVTSEAQRCIHQHSNATVPPQGQQQATAQHSHQEEGLRAGSHACTQQLSSVGLPARNGSGKASRRGRKQAVGGSGKGGIAAMQGINVADAAEEAVVFAARVLAQVCGCLWDEDLCVSLFFGRKLTEEGSKQVCAGWI